MGIFASPPPTVNSRGDVLSNKDFNALEGDTLPGNIAGAFGPAKDRLKLTLQQRSDMLLNWMTAGGPPKAVDPSKTFGDAQASGGVRAKAGAGAGINGLFGMGKMIGDLAPVTAPVGALAPMKMIEPMNQSPMQPGVPYSAIPAPGAR